MGRIAYNDKDYYHTVIWMTETLKQLEIEDSASVTKFDVLDYLAFSTGEQGNIQHALDITTEMLSIGKINFGDTFNHHLKNFYRNKSMESELV